MLYQESQKVTELKHRLQSFMDRHVYPNEERFYKEAEELGAWKVFPVVEELKPKAREAGLWNLFLPESEHGAGLTNLEYAPLCEVMGRSHLAPEVFNCSRPTPATWKCWRGTARASIRSVGSSRCWLAKSAPALP